MVEWRFIVRWIVGSIPHGGHIDNIFFQPVLHNWSNKGFDMYYPVWGMVHIKEPLQLIGKSSPWIVAVGFLSERSDDI